MSCYLLPKRAYNAVHPYTSFVPIFCYMVLRNCSPTLRRYHMHLFAWCGKVTLETYILQFHIWMKTTGINGSPKFLMVWLPGWYDTTFLLTLTLTLTRTLSLTLTLTLALALTLTLTLTLNLTLALTLTLTRYYTNFLLTSVVFLFVSYRVFKITVTLRDACIPRDGSRLVHNGLAMVVGVLALYGCGLGLKS